jgi:hypothetical protein
MELLAELKHPRTNWKYILIVVVLAFVVVAVTEGYQWLRQKEVNLPTIPQTEIFEAKKEITEDEALSIFLAIFPEGFTDTGLDEIVDINERAKAYLQLSIPSQFYLWDKVAWGAVEYVQLDENPDVELFVIHCLEERFGGVRPAMPDVGPMYVFRWGANKWNLIGEMGEFSNRSWYIIGKIQSGSFADIMIGGPAGGGRFSATRYQYKAGRYRLAENTICGEKQELTELCNEVWTGFEKRIK